MEHKLTHDVEYEWDVQFQKWNLIVRVYYNGQQTHAYQLETVTAAQMAMLDKQCGS